MESLYRKYRPLTFDDVVGQEHIVSTLSRAVIDGRISHAYLFCGPRGTGKTTMARILAKSLLCEKAATQGGGTGAGEPVGCLPDGTCSECRAIAEGTHPDVYELDAASRTGVDNVREEIINSVDFAPVRGRYKIYIIDEVHMLSTAAFNALLKTLEEPPAHVVFVLCTTDPQKLPETILSRCQRFDFHRISNEDIVGRLRHVCEQEGFSYDEEALGIVAQHARGGMRDALSTLEQLSVFGDGAVRAPDARALLGEASSDVLSRFSRGIAQRDTAGLFSLVREQVDAGNDVQELTRDLVAHMRDVYTAAIAGDRPELFDIPSEEVRACVEEAALFEGTDRLARALTVLDDAALEMRTASDPRLVLEIALTRLARPESDLTLESLAERVERLEAQLAGPSSGVSAAQGAGMPNAAAVPAAAAGAGTPVEPVQGAVSPSSRRSRTGSSSSSSSGPASAAGATSPAPTAKGGQRESGGTSAVSDDRAVPVAAVSPAAPPEVALPGTPDASSTAAPSAGAAPGRVEAGSASVDTVSAAAEGPSTSHAPAMSDEDAAELARRWNEVVARVKRAEPSRGSLFRSASAWSDDGEVLIIRYPKGSTFPLSMLARPDSKRLMQPIIEDVFGPRTVRYVMDGDPVLKAASKQAPPSTASAAESSRTPRTSAAASVSTSAEPASTGGVSAPVDQVASQWSSRPPAPASRTSRPASPAQVSPQHEGSEGRMDDHASLAQASQDGYTFDEVPYGDAEAADFGEEELPPIDLPWEEPDPTASAPDVSIDVPVQDHAANEEVPTSGSAPSTPQTAEEAKAMLGDIFGAGIIFKDENDSDGAGFPPD